MFFIGIFGIDGRQKEIRTFDNVVCGCCGRLSRAALIYGYTYLHIFFIPTCRWNRRFFVRLRCCGAMYEADGAYAETLKSAEQIDFSRLKKVSGGFGEYDGPDAVCAHCGARLDESFGWCPHCGAKR